MHKTTTVDDKEWEEFVAWWKSKWVMTTPDRGTIEIFLEWREAKIKGIDWHWSFEKPKKEAFL